jgi:hypothetical protein
MPASLYKMARRDGQDPVTLILGKAFQTSRQVRQPLLCDECEGRFNKSGETWILRNCWLSETAFGIGDSLRAAAPVVSTPSLRIYAGATVPGIDVGQLVYFGASVFWRAAAQEWRAPDGRPMRLGLGPYEDLLRRSTWRTLPSSFDKQRGWASSRRPRPLTAARLSSARSP